MKKISSIIVITLILTIFNICEAKHIHPERYYQDIWCAEQGGITEVVLEDGTRCDCLTDNMVTEVDFASKIFEGIGQALHYSMLTGKPGGLLLILESEDDEKYVDRALRIIEFYQLPIKIFSIKP